MKLMGEDKLKLWVSGKLQQAADLCHGTPLYSRVKLKTGNSWEILYTARNKVHPGHDFVI